MLLSHNFDRGFIFKLKHYLYIYKMNLTIKNTYTVKGKFTECQICRRNICLL